MDHVRCERQGDLLAIVLSRGKANALNAEMMEGLAAAVESALDPAVRGVVLASGCPRFFSAGFDVREVFDYPRDRMALFFGRFVQVYEALRALPKPVVAALAGHTFAGGSILALACDVRVMARGDFGFALSEINLGLVLTEEIGQMLAEAVGVGRARQLVLSGEPVSPQRAYEIGLVHELAEPEAVLERALAHAATMASKPPLAFAAMKRSLRAAAGSSPAEIDRFLAMWFSDEAAAARSQVAAKLGG